MVVQTAKDSVQNADGSIDREGSWVTLFANIKCNIQERSKQNVTERYGRKEEEHRDVIYHTNKDLSNYESHTDIRILTNKTRPSSKIVLPIHEEDNSVYKDDDGNLIDIFQFKGHIDQVRTNRNHGNNVFILWVERNKRWNP